MNLDWIHYFTWITALGLYCWGLFSPNDHDSQRKVNIATFLMVGNCTRLILQVLRLAG